MAILLTVLLYDFIQQEFLLLIFSGREAQWLGVSARAWSFRIIILLFALLAGALVYSFSLRAALLQERIDRTTKRLRQKEREARGREAEHKGILASLKDVIWAGDPETHEMVYLNPSAEALYGLPRESFFQNPDLWKKVVHPADQEKVMRYTSLLHQNGFVEMNYRIVRPDGEVRWVTDQGTVIRNQEGGARRLAGIVSDITEQVFAREGLKRSEEMIKSILNGAPIMIRAVDSRGIIKLCEGRSLEAIGETPGQAVGELVQNHFKDDFQQWSDWMRALSGETFTSIWSRRGYVFETFYSPLREDGKIVGAVCVGNDITTRQIAQEALEESEMRFRRLADSANEGVVISLDGTILEANEAFLRIFGLDEKEVEGLTAKDIVAPEACERTLEKIRNQDEGVYESIGKRKDGSRFPIEVYGRAIPYEGRMARVTSIRDITAEKRIRQELLEAIETAESASRAKSEFIANVSHEIRTPLNAVIGLAQILERSDLNAQQRDYIQTIHRSGDTLLSLLNDLLDLSKVDAGKLEIEKIGFDVRECVEAVGDLLAPKAQLKGLEFLVEIDRDVPRQVVGDPSRLQQILLNLAGNAVKFTSEGEVHIRVERETTEKEIPGRTTLLFSIEDTGIGISPEDRAKLFQPFSQVDSSTTRKYGGTGLGLAISRQLVHAMDGEIDVESEEGEGTRFSFTLPLLVSDSRTATETAFKLQILGGMKVLLVDENEPARRQLSGMLSSWGCEVTELSGGKPLLEMARENRDCGHFDAIILDQQLQDIQLADLLEELGKAVPDRTCPFILMTAATASSEELTLINEHFDTFIRKPIKRTQMLEALVNLSLGDDQDQDMGLSESSASQWLEAHAPDSPDRSTAVLVVEDNEINQLVAREMLRNAGIACEFAQNGLEALDMLKHKSYDLVFMDVQMPEMDGIEATRHLRESGCQTPVIAMTASALSRDRERCMEAGMDDYVTKPISMETLQEVLNQHLHRSSTQSGEQEGRDSHSDHRGPVDLDRLNIITAGDKDVMKEIADLFLKDGRKRLSEIRDALKEQNLEAVRKNAHALKGASMNLGAQELGATCAALENRAREASLPAMRREYAQACEQYREAEDFLHSRLGEGAAARPSGPR